ncbi:Predicted alpha/beta hydrolase [Acinetobacter marinus]|uniref:Predicted alpha/beta hydrolase n=1 Tax=Acinetobacter marinus TaxID=281375 RepID=A0A1G6JG53_9GAMM|nr:alpha/beta fold hydrolase [Acinetobacter marinus]SDC17633.1 Predicted alpha/beta hydrolase [Acinetobacter marinus]
MNAQTQFSLQAVDQQSLTFHALDNYALSGVRYRPKSQIIANMIIANATGVPQAFYRRFALYMAERGFQVFTFDYRGIAQSAPKSLKGFEMDYLDWGQLDLSGVINQVAKDAAKDGIKTFLIGHSYGGQALGLVNNSQKLTACMTFGSGVGWKGYMPKVEAFKVSIIWNVVFPAMALRYGYVPWSKLKMGADLPLGVYQQWKQWCKYPNYFFDDPDMQYLHAQYAKVTTPIIAVTSTDDEWAMPISRDALHVHYKNAQVTNNDLTPQQFGLKQIGHMGYFRQGAEQIWDHVIGQFQQYL